MPGDLTLSGSCVAVDTAGGTNPLVSVIVPSFNQGRFIRRTLESILSQDYRPLEIIVIDGASTDETLSILEEFSGAPELQWISEPDRGVVDAVNKGFARARGEIGAIQSSDDFYLPGAIATAVAALQSEPELAFVFGDIAKVDAEGMELSRTQLAEYTLEGVLTMRTWIPQPSTFFRMLIAKSLGGWREAVPYAADTDLWLRMAMQHPAKRISRLMAQRSMHDAQRDSQGKRIIRDYRLMLRTLPGLSSQPEGVRRAARASAYLIANRYDRESGLLKRHFRLWRAVTACPALLDTVSVSALVPGWGWLRSLSGRFLRRVAGL